MNYILWFISILVIGSLAFIWNWFNDDKSPASGMSVANSIIVSELDLGISESEENRYVALQTEYKKLEKARRNIDRKLARIKALIWRLELPAEQAKNISARIRKGHALLKLKKLSGAFLDLQDIRSELAQVLYVDQDLQKVIEEINAAKAAL